MKKAKFILTIFSFVFCVQAQAGLLFNYSQLALKDLDQMNKLVMDKVAESKKEKGNKVVPLKEALQAIYSRPNEDGMIEKVVAPLRTNLDELEAWEKTVTQLSDEALNALRNPKAFKPVVQVTYVVFLENLLAEAKPHLKKNGFERKIVETIRDAKIQVTKEAVNERKLRTMKSTVSPSELAEKILSQITVEPAKNAEDPEVPTPTEDKPVEAPAAPAENSPAGK
ncbi:MAG: hypothetical protein ACXWRZ_12780 [Bdellovibrio sp.]